MKTREIQFSTIVPIFLIAFSVEIAMRLKYVHALLRGLYFMYEISTPANLTERRIADC